jgi:hypothetical protein
MTSLPTSCTSPKNQQKVGSLNKVLWRAKNDKISMICYGLIFERGIRVFVAEIVYKYHPSATILPTQHHFAPCSLNIRRALVCGVVDSKSHALVADVFWALVWKKCVCGKCIWAEGAKIYIMYVGAMSFGLLCETGKEMSFCFLYADLRCLQDFWYCWW